MMIKLVKKFVVQIISDPLKLVIYQIKMIILVKYLIKI